MLAYIFLAPPCNESEVRLLNDQVQICHNRVWGYVCENNDWTNNDAAVVCREVGLFPQGEMKIMIVSHYFSIFIYIFCRCIGFIQIQPFNKLFIFFEWAQLQWFRRTSY